MKFADQLNLNEETVAKLKSYVYDIVGCCQEVHRELGPWLNEYIYQEALRVALEEKHIPFVKEYYFQVTYHGQPLLHKHYMDFLCKEKIVV
jgi:GxxExxY protein